MAFATPPPRDANTSATGHRFPRARRWSHPVITTRARRPADPGEGRKRDRRRGSGGDLPERPAFRHGFVPGRRAHDHLSGERRARPHHQRLGRWPKAASIEWFEKNCGGEIPAGVRRAVTPAAIDAWLTALARYGTMTFAEVAEDAISLAGDGFAMHHFMYDHIKSAEEDYYRWESTRPVYFPGGELIPVGKRVRIPELAETMRRMVRAEQRAGGGRAGGVRAARDEVYTGETARLMVDFIGREGGLMTMDDLADFHVLEEEPVVTEFLGMRSTPAAPGARGRRCWRR